MNDTLSIKSFEEGSLYYVDTQSQDQGALWPLQEWYLSVCELPFSKYTERDLGIAVRQGIHPEHVVPYVIDILEGNPDAGFGYDGELFESLRNLGADFWISQPNLVARVRAILELSPNDCDFDLAKLRLSLSMI